MTNSSKQANSIPTDTVTFLFTDIEGSTKMWERHRPQMQPAIKRHDDIFRSNLKAKGGYVFSTGGDSFCAAFDTAEKALQAALAIQRDLSAEEWPEPIEVRVRMGLHSGKAEERDGNFFGPQVNRAARLMSAGHGRQVLLSSVTYGLVRDELAHLQPGAELRYLGEHHLKDLRYTERIFQLEVPDLPKAFPPLKTLGLVAELVNLDRRYGHAEWIGGGGFGEVYLVHHAALDKDMALKVLRRRYANDAQFVKLFEREAKNAAALDHPNIVAVYDAGEGLFEGRKASYIAMEYVSGGTLRGHIEKEGPLPTHEAIELTLQVAEALGVAHRHEKAIVHRDIKPANILLTESGEAKVADFGIAKAAASSTTLAQAGEVLGTPHYISPEQVMGEPASPRSDLYSLGVVLYEMLTGKVPYDAENLVGVAMKHVNAPLRPPKEVNPDVPEEINAVCVKLLAKDPEERYPDADALMADLEAVKNNPDAEKDGTEPEKKTVEVPNLAGQTESQARSTLVTQNLKHRCIPKPVSSTVPKNKVARQTPEAGTMVQPGKIVTFRLSSGPPIKVPDLIGRNRSEASDALEEVGLTLGSQTSVWNKRTPEGQIVGQRPEAGTKVEAGSLVNITFNRRRVAVLDVSDKNIGEAEQAIQDLGLVVAPIRTEKRSLKPRGTVISTSPPAGSEIPLGNLVTLTVSIGLALWVLVVYLIVLVLLGVLAGVWIWG